MKSQFIAICLLASVLCACSSKEQLPSRFGHPASVSEWKSLDITSGTWQHVKTYMKTPDGGFSDDLLGGNGTSSYSFSPSGKCTVVGTFTEGNKTIEYECDWSYKQMSSILVIGEESYELRVGDFAGMFLVDQRQPLLLKLERK